MEKKSLKQRSGNEAGMFDGLGVWARRFGLLSLLGVAGCATAPSLPPMTPEMSARSEEALRLKAAETWVGKTFLCLPPNPSAAPKAATDWFKAKTGLTEAQIRERFILEPDPTPQANGLTLVRVKKADPLKIAETWIGKTFLCLPPNPAGAPKAATDWFKAKTGLTEAQIRERFILEPDSTPQANGLTLVRVKKADPLKNAETWVGKTFLCLPPNPSAAPKAATDWFKAKTGLTEAQIRERFILEPDSTPQANGLTLVRVKGKTSMAPEKARIVNQNLLVAVSTNDLANAKLWLDRGADANASQSDLSALLLALDRGNADMVRLLHSKGADLNDMNSNGISPLLFASSKRGSPMARVLVELGANVNIPDPNGITPLMMIASISGDLSLVELMVGKGADVNAKDKKGATAVDYAIQQKNQSLVEFLTSHGAKYPGAVAQ